MMTEEWVMLWYQCLSENYDYSMYSKAKDEGDTRTCADYEARFDRIADIYQDFGTLRSLTDWHMESDIWREWFPRRKHLFLPDVQVGSALSSDTTHLNLMVPLDGPIEETVAEAARLIRSACERNPQMETRMPKYRLHTVNGKTVHDVSVVRKSVITSINKWLNATPGEETPDVAGLIQAFAWQYLHAMEWKLGDAEYEALQRTHRLPVHRVEAFTTIVNRYRLLFRALSRNTIRGRFPDKSPYKSLVWDRFKGEQTYK
jgi:hypothetical protein